MDTIVEMRLVCINVNTTFIHNDLDELKISGAETESFVRACVFYEWKYMYFFTLNAHPSSLNTMCVFVEVHTEVMWGRKCASQSVLHGVWLYIYRYEGDGKIACNQTCYYECIHGVCSGHPDYECSCDLGWTNITCDTDCGCNNHSTCFNGTGICDLCQENTYGMVLSLLLYTPIL